MSTLLSTWRRSVSYITSLRKVCQLLVLVGRGWPTFVGTIVGLGVLIGAVLPLQTAAGASVRWLLSLPLPLPAMLLSAFYLPPLIQAHERDGRSHNWIQYFLSSALFYGTASGVAYILWLQYSFGSDLLRTGLIGAGIALAPLIIFFGTISPFLVLSMSYAPTANRSFSQQFRHSVYMTGAELPALAGAFLLLLPLTLGVYYLPLMLVQHNIIAAAVRLPVMHVCSVVYWQVGWSLFIALYQERKATYI